MNIGEAARTAGLPAKVIRYYERVGLIRSPARNTPGYRTYAEEDVRTLRFLRHARELGFSVEAMRELLALWRDEERTSADVKRLALCHAAELKREIERLQHSLGALNALTAACEGDERPACAIIAAFSASSDEASPDADGSVRHRRIVEASTRAVSSRCDQA